MIRQISIFIYQRIRFEIRKSGFWKVGKMPGRVVILAQNKTMREIDHGQVQEVINSLDDQGRWVETGRLKTGDQENPYIEAQIISTRTFIQNMSVLSAFVESQKK